MSVLDDKPGGGKRSSGRKVPTRHQWIYEEIAGIQRDDDKALAEASAEADDAAKRDREDERRKRESANGKPKQSPAMMSMEAALEQMRTQRTPPRRPGG